MVDRGTNLKYRGKVITVNRRTGVMTGVWEHDNYGFWWQVDYGELKSFVHDNQIKLHAED